MDGCTFKFEADEPQEDTVDTEAQIFVFRVEYFEQY
jgi:hypothetical protein